MGDADDDDSRKKQKRKMKEQNSQSCSDKEELKSKKSPWKALRITASSYPKGVEAIVEYKCPECDKTFTRTQALGRHRRMHRTPIADIGVNNSNKGGVGSSSSSAQIGHSEIPSSLAETANRNVELADEDRQMANDSNIQEIRKSKRKKFGNSIPE